jgi:hypothetical protein
MLHIMKAYKCMGINPTHSKLWHDMEVSFGFSLGGYQRRFGTVDEEKIAALTGN